MSLYDDSNPQHLEYLAHHQAARAAREKTMIDADNIAHAAAAFIAADAAYAAHEAITREQALDLAIAERNNDADAIHDAQVARKAHHAAWHALYVARQDTADALVRSTGVDPRKIADAIKRY